MKKQFRLMLALMLALIMALGAGAMAEPVSGVSNEIGVDVGGAQGRAYSLLTMELTADRASALPGATVNYTLTIVNSGNAAATGRTVSARVGDGLTLAVDSAAGATVQDNLAIWSGVTIPARDFVTIDFSATLSATAQPGDGFTASASLDGNTVEAVVLAAAAQDITLKKTYNPINARPGDAVVVELTVENASDADTQVTLSDVLPQGLELADQGLNYDEATRTISWASTSLAAHSVMTLSYNARVAADAADGAKLTGEATAAAAGLSVSAAATLTVRVPRSALTIQKSVSDETPAPGDTIKYTLIIRNAGTADAVGAVVTDVLPDGLTLDAGSISSDASYNAHTLTWTLDVAAGSSVSRSYRMKVPSDAQAGDSYINTVYVEEETDSVEVTVSEAEPVLTIQKSVNNRTPEPGDWVKYTIRVKNASGVDAQDVRVVDTLPIDLYVDEDSITRGGDYDYYDDAITWLADVDAHSTVTMTFWAQVDEYAEDGEALVNRARIAGGDSSKATIYVTEDAVPKTGEADVVPAAWWQSGGTGIDQNQSDIVEASDTGASTMEYTDDMELPAVQEDFAEQLTLNQDLIGQLVVGDIVDEMVYQLDNQYYMTHDGAGNESESGALFLDERNLVYPRDANLIIYGHNMKSGAMFGDLDKYRTLDYLNQYPIISFRSIYDEQAAEYVPFAIFDASMDADNADYIKIRRPNFDNEEEAREFIQQMRDRSIYNLPVDAESGDQLLLLVTCSYSHSNGRFIIAARKLREGEDAQSIGALFAEQASARA